VGVTGSASGRVLVVDMDAPDAAQRFVTSLHDSGFALLAGHGIPTRAIREITEEWGRLFDKGVPERYWSGNGVPWGYHRSDGGLMPDGTRRDTKDFYHYGLGRPQPDEVSQAAAGLFGRAVQIASTLLGWLDEISAAPWAAGRPNSSWLSPRQSVLRLQRYLPLDVPAEPGSIRALAHADINLLTLLPAPEVAGLQLRDTDGTWVDLEYDPELVIVNVGEMLQTASGGYYPATLHRVVVRDPESSLRERWSVPMFFHPEDEVELAPGITAGGFRTARVEDYRRKGWLVSTGGGSRSNAWGDE
jgi:isopenicillin N synthase-like dioxygenase